MQGIADKLHNLKQSNATFHDKYNGIMEKYNQELKVLGSKLETINSSKEAMFCTIKFDAITARYKHQIDQTFNENQEFCDQVLEEMKESNCNFRKHIK